MRGVTLATVAAGIKGGDRPDLVLIGLPAGSTCGAVFTQNAFAAAPVQLCRQHLHASSGAIRALLINSGNANAGTGEPGLAMARGHCAAVADRLSIDAQAVLPFSTGVIGQLLPEERMQQGIALAVDTMGTAGMAEVPGGYAPLCDWQSAADGIMTTDTVAKLTSRQIEIDGERVSVTGLAKGAGMIEPHMATMLAYVFTDARIDQPDVQGLLEEAVAVSFNAITVDSDTSTNDSSVLCATGAGPAVSSEHDQWSVLRQAVIDVCTDLAQAIVRDAEGATKFITVRVTGGRTVTECRGVAYAIANSPLVKTACFASDANVGRLLMAIGKADIEQLDAAAVQVSLGEVVAFERGGIADGYTEERGAAEMAGSEITVSVDLARGKARAEVYTSDLSHEYVSINADYRS